MFVIYGDPKSSKPPTFSVRTSSGHAQPEVMSGSDPEVRLISSTWQRPSANSHYPPSTYLASISFVCRDISKWTGTNIDVLSADQPWIWATNAEQSFSGFETDAWLEPHSHQHRHDSTGMFTVDMRPIKPPGNAAPQPDRRPDLGTHGQSGDQEPSWFTRSRLWTLHGALLGVAFVALYPAGAVSMRMGFGCAFKYHWILQLLGTILLTAGAMTGLALHPRLDGSHQRVGFAILVLAWTQVLLGLQHHIRFLKTSRRTWISTSHVWLGRLLMAVGCGNVLLGMSIRGRGRAVIGTMFVLIVLELVSIAYYGRSARSTLPHRSADEGARFHQARAEDDCFAIGDDDGDDEERTSGQFPDCEEGRGQEFADEKH